MALYQYRGEEDYDATLFGNYHGVMEIDPVEMPIQKYQVPGLYGEAHLIDKTKGRHISCYIRYQGFSSYNDLEVNLAGVEAVLVIDANDLRSLVTWMQRLRGWAVQSWSLPLGKLNATSV